MYDDAPVPEGWTQLDRLFVPEDEAPVALVLKDSSSGATALAVRGSQTGWDWKEDFTFLFADSPWGVGRVETGFSTYFNSAKTESSRPLPPCDWIGGHSLGGPAATYFACCMAPGTVDLLVAETPEPGDEAFSNWASPRLAAIHRWENPDDVVPDAPGRFLGYRDLAGDPVVLDLRQLGVGRFDLGGNHSLSNCVAAFKIQNNLR